MSILAQQYVLRLDVAIDNVTLVEVAQPQEDLDDVKPTDILTETPVSFDEAEEFTPRAVLDNKH